jgi:hypothetical protein
MGDAGKMNHGLDAAEQRAPFHGPRQVGDRHHLDRAREHIRRLAHGGADRVAGARQFGDERTSDKA